MSEEEKTFIQKSIEYIYNNAEPEKKLCLYSDYNIRSSFYKRKDLDGCGELVDDFISLHVVKTPVKNKKIWEAIKVMIQNFRNETNSYNSKFPDGNDMYIFSAPVISAGGKFNKDNLYGVGFAHFEDNACECMWIHPFFRGKGIAKDFFLQYAKNVGFFTIAAPVSVPMQHVAKSLNNVLCEDTEMYLPYFKDMAHRFYKDISDVIDRSRIKNETLLKFKEGSLTIFEIIAIKSMCASAHITSESLLQNDDLKKTGVCKEKINDISFVSVLFMMNNYLSENERITDMKGIEKFTEASRKYGMEMLKKSGVEESEMKEILKCAK